MADYGSSSPKTQSPLKMMLWLFFHLFQIVMIAAPLRNEEF